MIIEKQNSTIQVGHKDLRDVLGSTAEISKHDETFCLRCRKINFERIFNIDVRQLPANGTPVHDLGMFSKDVPPSSCALCKMFWKMACTSEAWDSQYELRAMPSIAFEKPDSGDESSIVLGLRSWTTSRRMLTIDKLALRDRGMIRVECLTPNKSHDQSREDHRLLLSSQSLSLMAMLNMCSSDHRRCRPTDLEWPDGARVIDCDTRSVVLLTPGTRYLALSYVWGDQVIDLESGSSKSRVETGLLPQDVPQTIEDAITIAKNVGIPYLWVDRYCIKQYHSIDKMQQINQMANIYAHAEATICALGKDDRTGICGISRPRIPLASVQVLDRVLVWTGARIRHHVMQSCWKMRGWTLQEALLSRRCLLFTNDGVTMLCSSGVWREASTPGTFCTVLRGNSSYHETDLFFSPQRKNNSGPLPNNIEGRFATLRDEYLSRQLGHQSDVLNAFRAIVQYVRILSYWGIPLYHVVSATKQEQDLDLNNVDCSHNLLASFLDGLFWSDANALELVTPSGKTTTRRQWDGVPSWSWMSRTTSMTNVWRDNNLVTEKGILRPSFTASVDIVRADNTCVNLVQFLDTFRKDFPKSFVVPEQSKYLELHSIVLSWESNPNTDTFGALQSTQLHWLEVSGKEGSVDVPAWIRFDDPTNSISNPRTNGFAVLLNSSVASAKARWLAIVPISDNAFERVGIILSDHQTTKLEELSTPHQKMLRRIRLA